MPALVLDALAAFAAALALWLSASVPTAAAAHLVLAAGILPLILGAMTHFVPVLTRGPAHAPAIRAIPWCAAAGGLIGAAAMASPALYPFGIQAGAALALAGGLGLLGWIVRRARAAIGAPHPCLYWYVAAIAFLVLAHTPQIVFFPAGAHRGALRSFHLHANTLGFVGLSAIGTLQVLMPTAAGRPDPGAAARLRRDLPWAVAGVLLAAAGAAWNSPFAAAGALALLVPAGRLARAWFALFRREILARDGAAPALALALAGYVALLAAGIDHTLHPGSGARLPVAFVAGFLLPLVTGAVSQLFPVWLRPGAQTQWHTCMRRALGRHAALRCACFIVAGALADRGYAAGLALAAATLALFACQLALALRRCAGDGPRASGRRSRPGPG